MALVIDVGRLVHDRQQPCLAQALVAELIELTLLGRYLVARDVAAPR